MPEWLTRGFRPRPLMTVFHPDGKRKLEVLPPLDPAWQFFGLVLLNLSVISEAITIFLEGPWNAWSWFCGVAFGICMGNIGRLMPRSGTNNAGDNSSSGTRGEAP